MTTWERFATQDRIVRGLAVAMLAVSVAFTLALTGVIVRAEELPLILALTGLLAAYRVWLVLHPVDVRVRQAAFWASIPVVTALIVMSPLFGLYAFLGYLEGPSLFPGRLGWATVAISAALTALSQMGGPRSGLASPGIYLLFLAANLLIAGLMGHLENRSRRRTLELQRALAELQSSERRNAELREQLVAQARESGVQDERARLSREIHDTVAQGLVGIIRQLEAVEDAGHAERDARLRLAQDAARDSLAEARRAVRALASPRLDAGSLPSALESLVDHLGQSTGVDARLVVDGEPESTAADPELLRVAQEALSNVARHADAARAAVTLTYTDDEVRLDVYDDGRGFDPARAPGHGVPGMRERVAALGGQLEIETSAGGGCTVSAAVPR